MTTPPPQGQQPYAPDPNQPYGQPQGGNPYGQQGQQGQQQPGGNPFGQQQQPGVPQQPSPYFNQGTPVPPPARRSGFKKYKNIAILVVGVLVVGGGYLASRDDAENAEVGDCLKSASSSSDKMEVVDCTSTDAETKVVKKVDGTFTSISAETECRKVASATSFYAQTGDGDNFLLCTKDAK